MPKESKNREQPIRIPLPFEKAVEGLLGVDPKKLSRRPARAKKTAKTRPSKK